MFSLPYQLSRAFAFSGIERVGWTRPFKWLPVLAALLVGSVFLFLPSKPPLTGGDGLCRLLELVFSVLPGFFIAALAAVATFGKQELDYEMPDPAPTIILRVENKEEDAKLTTRMFLSLMFSYLTAMSLMALLLCVTFESVHLSFRTVLRDYVTTNQAYVASIGARTICVAVLSWFTSKIILTTFLGLYFLGERIHRPVA